MSKENRAVISVWVMLPIMLFIAGGTFGMDSVRLIATARDGGSDWKYLESNRRMTNWMGLTFNDKKWKSGSAGFGNMNHGGLTKTPWGGGQKDLYLRKEFKYDFKVKDIEKVELQYAIDDSIEIWLNGKSIFNTEHHGAYEYSTVDVTEEFKSLVRESGRSNIMAVKAHDKGRDCYVDVGLVVKVEVSNDKGKKDVSKGRDSGRGKETGASQNTIRSHETGESETNNRTEKKELLGVGRIDKFLAVNSEGAGEVGEKTDEAWKNEIYDDGKLRGLEYDKDKDKNEGETEMVMLIPSADVGQTLWRYQLTKPGVGWQKLRFNDVNWNIGKNGFDGGNGWMNKGTHWGSDELYLRKVVDVNFDQKQIISAKLRFAVDDIMEVWINEELSFSQLNVQRGYCDVSDEIIAKRLKKGKNIIAVRAFNKRGVHYVDLGIWVEVKKHTFK